MTNSQLTLLACSCLPLLQPAGPVTDHALTALARLFHRDNALFMFAPQYIADLHVQHILGSFASPANASTCSSEKTWTLQGREVGHFAGIGH